MSLDTASAAATSAADKITLVDVQIDYVNDETGQRHVAVRDFNLAIRENEFLCVVGASGCGKSTVLSSIAGFLPPVAGQLQMNGRPVTGPGADRGVVFQEYALLPWLKVIDNVALGLKLRGVPKSERHEKARYFLDIANLTAAADKYPHELSGGMKQRVAVIRTLANEPEVMLMDEPFAAIDAQTRMTLQEELLRVWGNTRTTVLFVTHSVEEAVFLADRVAVLSPGPGRVQEIVDIHIPRDARHWSSIGDDPRFISARDRVLHLVRGGRA